METTLMPPIFGIKVVNMFLPPVSRSVLLIPVSQLLHLSVSQFFTSSAVSRLLQLPVSQFFTSSYRDSSFATCQSVASAACHSVLLLVKSEFFWLSSQFCLPSQFSVLLVKSILLFVKSVLLIVKSVLPLPVSQYIAVCVLKNGRDWVYQDQARCSFS